VRLEILGRLPEADDPRLSKRQRKRLRKALRRASRRGRPLDSKTIDEVLVAVDPERGPFAVQVGAFAVDANARRLARALSEAGWPSFTWEGPDDLRRVRVGPQPDRATAERVEARLRAAGHPTFVVRVD